MQHLLKPQVSISGSWIELLLAFPPVKPHHLMQYVAHRRYNLQPFNFTVKARRHAYAATDNAVRMTTTFPDVRNFL